MTTRLQELDSELMDKEMAIEITEDDNDCTDAIVYAIIERLDAWLAKQCDLRDEAEIASIIKELKDEFEYFEGVRECQLPITA